MRKFLLGLLKAICIKLGRNALDVGLAFAVATVQRLGTTDLTNEQKREQAFTDIKNGLMATGKDFADSTVNLLIELAVNKLKHIG